MTNTDVVRGVYEAFARGDVLEVLGAMDPHIEWREAEGFAYADGNPYVGQKAVTEGILLRLATDWDSFAAKPERVIAAGDTVVVLGRLSGRFRVTGKSVDAQFVHVWTVREGKLTAFQEICDTAQMRDAMGGTVAAAI